MRRITAWVLFYLGRAAWRFDELTHFDTYRLANFLMVKSWEIYPSCQGGPWKAVGE